MIAKPYWLHVYSCLLLIYKIDHVTLTNAYTLSLAGGRDQDSGSLAVEQGIFFFLLAESRKLSQKCDDGSF